MKPTDYITLLIILAASIYTMSFARQSWGKGNKQAAFGAMLAVASAFAASVAAIIIK